MVSFKKYNFKSKQKISLTVKTTCFNRMKFKNGLKKFLPKD
jgi:hypothetical protein